LLGWWWLCCGVIHLLRGIIEELLCLGVILSSLSLVYLWCWICHNVQNVKLYLKFVWTLYYLLNLVMFVEPHYVNYVMCLVMVAFNDDMCVPIFLLLTNGFWMLLIWCIDDDSLLH
jgi:hypothetical protein